MKRTSIIVIVFSCVFDLVAQNDLESFLNPAPQNTVVINTFKSTRIINNHSIELFNTRQLDVRIAHRFGLLNSGVYELYGLDQAKMRMGLEYGLMNNLMVGVGRSTYNKTYDGYIKYRILEQSRGQKNIPISILTSRNGLASLFRNNYKGGSFYWFNSLLNHWLI